MTETEALAKMIAPGTPRPSKWRQGVIQIWVTRHCDKSCFNCTQGSNLATVSGVQSFMTPEQFEGAVLSLRGYWGVVGVFGGNPVVSPYFESYCEVMRRLVPYEQRGLWSNNPITLERAQVMRATFNPAVSNLNVHLDRTAYDLFKEGWPECRPVGLTQDSRHSPPFVAMKDVLKKQCPKCLGFGVSTTDGRVFVNPPPESCTLCGGTGQVYDEGRAWELISGCDINHYWSAMIGVFRGELRAWFCEIAGAQAMLHQMEDDYPDTGLDPLKTDLVCSPITTGGMFVSEYWWQLPTSRFAHQVRKHCHECGVPLRGQGELAQAKEDEVGNSTYQPREQVSVTHQAIYHPKRKGRRVELVTIPHQLGAPLARMTDYLGNARR